MVYGVWGDPPSVEPSEALFITLPWVPLGWADDARSDIIRDCIGIGETRETPVHGDRKIYRVVYRKI